MSRTRLWSAFASDANPYYVLGHALWGPGWWLVVLAIINSAVGVGLASTNAASRVMYTMGRAGTLPARFGYIHPIHRHSPDTYIRDRLCADSRNGGDPDRGVVVAPRLHLRFLETIATLAVIILYAMANLALTRYMHREQRPISLFGNTSCSHGSRPWRCYLSSLSPSTRNPPGPTT